MINEIMEVGERNSENFLTGEVAEQLVSVLVSVATDRLETSGCDILSADKERYPSHLWVGGEL